MIRWMLVAGMLTASLGGAGQKPEKPAETPRKGATAAQAPAESPVLPRDWEDADLQELIETVKIVRLSRELGLNNEQAVVLVREYEEARDRLATLRRQRQDALKQLKEAINAEEDDASINQKLKAAVDLDQEIADLRFDLVQRAHKNLTPIQTAKLYVFLSEFETDMRRLLQRAREQEPMVMRMRERLEHELPPGEPGARPRFRPGSRGNDAPPPPPPHNAQPGDPAR